jgi:hypothetical protein
MSRRIKSSRGLVFSQVEVVATNPSTSNSFAYTKKADERFLVVRFIGNVREDEQARFFLRARRTDKRNHQGENGKRFDHKIYFDGISVLKV